ncbi:MAG: hypothetical protein PHW52_02160 [Candidatus Pacebacteria bacterium]|nr:hypothetical protein [Candidatus Paceibacterota bacterium]
MVRTSLLYHRVVRRGKKIINTFFEIERIERLLLEKGMKGSDISSAINLMACLLYLDSLVFCDNRIGNFFFSLSMSDKANAKYNHPSYGLDPVEKYCVRVNNIFKDMKGFSSKILLYGKDGENTMSSYDDLPFSSYQQRMIAIAAHEVRHRLQVFGINAFLMDKSYDDMQVDRYVLSVRRAFEGGDYSHVEDPVKRSYEFDARVIEMLALLELHYGADESRIRDIIKTEGRFASDAYP